MASVRWRAVSPIPVHVPVHHARYSMPNVVAFANRRTPPRRATSKRPVSCDTRLAAAVIATALVLSGFPAFATPPPITPTSIHIFYNTVCTITADSELYCWGSSDAGQIEVSTGTNFMGNKPIYSPRYMLGSVSSVAISDNHICAIVNAVVECWGNNLAHQLGNGANTNTLAFPSTASPTYPGAPLQLVSGSSFSCVLVSDASVSCWGSN